LRIIVIGGVAAGMSAAAEAKRCDESAEVIVLERGEHVSYGACGLPYFIANPSQKAEELIALTPETAAEKKHVIVKTLSEVLKIEPKEKKVAVRNAADNSEENYSYDKLIIATGASPVIPKINGVENEKVFFLRTLNDGIRLKNFIYGNMPKSAVVIGDGHIAIEMAEAFKRAGVDRVTMVTRRKHLCWWLDPECARLVEEAAVKNSITILKETEISNISETGGVITVETSGGPLNCSFVFVSLGMNPNSGLAKEAGIKTGQRGAIEVNTFCETNVDDIYAAGDCATVYSIPLKEKIYMPRGTTANKQGRCAGYNAAGVKSEMKGVTDIVVFKAFGLEVGRVGLCEEEAKRKKIEAVSVMIKSVTRAGYMAGQKRIHVKLIADKKSAKLIGAQIIGGEGVAKRIDVVSAAIYNEMTAEDFRQLDMSYSPPLAPVWDPLLIAGNQLYKAVTSDQ
jgi:CoA-dependent NAD(P)H sulfur oxidoreductase